MSAAITPRKHNPRRSKQIRRKMKGNERQWLAQTANLATNPQSSEESRTDGMLSKAGAPADDQLASGASTMPDIKITKIGQSLIATQTVVYSEGQARPQLEARLRLTTAFNGKRKQDGLVEIAYLLRLEVLACSSAIRVEGLKLGPWQFSDLKLEAGGIYLAKPVWTAFQPHSGAVNGRVYLGDCKRHRLIDLPFKTEAIIPGTTLVTS
jgi:hypothetical protein